MKQPKTNIDKPEPGKIYSLTGAGPSIANGNSWAESAVKCTQCGKDTDLLTAFTKYPICGECTRKNQAKI